MLTAIGARMTLQNIILNPVYRQFGSFAKKYHLTGVGLKTKTVMQPVQQPAIAPMVMDVPTLMGGENTAPQPVEMLLAALCGCEQVTAMYVARQMKPRLVIEKIEFDVHATRDQRGSLTLPIHEDTELEHSRVERIWGTATIHLPENATHVPCEDTIKLLVSEVKRRCPVANMVVLSGCELDIRYVLANTSSNSTDKTE